MAMRLEEVRDVLRKEVEIMDILCNDRTTVRISHFQAWADAIDAHLTQPAQAVDVGDVPAEKLDQMAIDAAIARCGFQHSHIEHKFRIPDQRRIMALMYKDGFRAALSALPTSPTDKDQR